MDLNEALAIEITDYTPQYADDFRRLNHEWIQNILKSKRRTTLL